MNNCADLVVIGTIYTAEDNEVCGAVAVKDGKYVYVGDREGAAACWGRKTMEIKPAKGKDYFPATVEKLVAGLYGLVTDRYGRRNALS